MLTRRAFQVLLPAITAWTAPTTPGGTAAEVLASLRQGHLRFASGVASHPHSSRQRIHEVATQSQHPRAVVLCCSNSRVVPELIFDQGIGDLFVVRVAGNVANEDEIASIEYAVEHFHVPLVLVMGHSHCGAVSAVVHREAMPPEVRHMVVHIDQAVTFVRRRQPELHGEALVNAAISRNVKESLIDLLAGGKILRDRHESGKLRLQGCVYQLDTGLIQWLPAER